MSDNYFVMITNGVNVAAEVSNRRGLQTNAHKLLLSDDTQLSAPASFKVRPILSATQPEFSKSKCWQLPLWSSVRSIFVSLKLGLFQAWPL